MKLEITLERLAGVTDCIIDNGLDRDEAFEYAKSMLIDCNTENVIDSDVLLIEANQ